MARPFRFGCQAFAPANGAAWRDTARRAEDAGYATLSLADHYIGPGLALDQAAHPLQTVAAIPAMMAAADATTSIMVGCRVLCVDYHHPVVLAKELATIDLLSDGRLEAGFGAGWITSEYAAMGIEMDRPGIRIQRLEEVVALARAFFAGETIDVDGEHVTATSFEAVPAAVQEGGPRVMVGGGRPRVLGLAGRMADIVSINFDNSAGKIGGRGLRSGTAEGTTDKIDWIRDGAGDRFDQLELEIAAYFTTVTDERQATLDMLAPAFGFEPAELAEHPHALIGSVDQICETLQQRREQYGISYVTVNDDQLDAFAPVVARLSGT